MNINKDDEDAKFWFIITNLKDSILQFYVLIEIGRLILLTINYKFF
jgi:hypothetical protein